MCGIFIIYIKYLVIYIVVGLGVAMGYDDDDVFFRLVVLQY